MISGIIWSCQVFSFFKLPFKNLWPGNIPGHKKLWVSQFFFIVLIFERDALIGPELGRFAVFNFNIKFGDLCNS